MESGICQDSKCSSLEVLSKKILFKFTVNGKKPMQKEFKITNISKVVKAISIDNPLTDYFNIMPQLSKGYLTAGETARVIVNLKSGLNPRTYYDLVQVHCPHKCVIQVALEAVPKVKTLKNIPRSIDLGHVALGHTITKKLTLSQFKVDTLFIFLVKERYQDLVISPTRGVVKYGGPPVEVILKFKPTSYVTLHADVFLYLPSIMFNPFVFTVTAHTKPGYCRNIILRQPSEDRVIINPLGEKPFTHPTWLLKPAKFKLPKKNLPIWSQHKSNKLIFKQMNKKRSSFELLGPLGRYLDEEEAIAKMKEQTFFEELICVHRSNFLAYSHTRTKLRNDPTSIISNEFMWSDYLKQYDIPIFDDERLPQYIRQRTIKWMDREEKMHLFTDKLSNVWFPRYVTMSKFIEAGRRIIYKIRLLKVLKRLKQLDVKSVVSYEIPPVDPF